MHPDANLYHWLGQEAADMKYLRCKCGKCQSWSSIGAEPPCTGCTDCGTTLETHPLYHSSTEPHEWAIVYDEYSGKPKERRCQNCYTNSPLETPKQSDCTRVQRKLQL
jgi:hypothetical protein